jgi:WD40 repeat protein
VFGRTGQHSLIAAVSSEKTIKLYGYEAAVPGSNRTASIQHFSELRGHTGAIHDVKFHNVHNSYDTAQVETAPGGACMLSSCSQDGTVRFWDARQQSASMVFAHPQKKPFISCASAGNLLAAGSGPMLFLWDLRNQQLLAQNEDFHTEDINQIGFHPLNPSTFFTASEDGLICELNTQDPNQDEWLQNVLNTENPVSRFGFFGPQADYIWALSCVETLSLWNIEQCERVSDFANIRDGLSLSANMPIDYLIDAHYDQQQQRVFLATGCNTGDLVLAHVNRTEIQPFSRARAPAASATTAAASSSSSSSSTGINPLTGFQVAPLLESPFARSVLAQTAPAEAAENQEAMMEDDDEEEKEDGVDFLKDGEVIMNQHDDNAMADSSDAAAEEMARPPLDATAEGHSATIRDILWFDKVLITGGEDSRLCVWAMEQAAAPASGSAELKIKQHAAKPSANGSAAAASSSASPPTAKSGRQYSPY